MKAEAKIPIFKL